MGTLVARAMTTPATLFLIRDDFLLSEVGIVIFLHHALPQVFLESAIPHWMCNACPSKFETLFRCLAIGTTTGMLGSRRFIWMLPLLNSEAMIVYYIWKVGQREGVSEKFVGI